MMSFVRSDSAREAFKMVKRASKAEARRLLVTKFLWRTVAAATAAYFVTYLAFVVRLWESVLTYDLDFWPAFGRSIEEAFIAGLATSATACLTYFEADKEFTLGTNSGGFAFCSLVSAFVCLVSFFIAHNPSNNLHDHVARGGWAGVLGLSITILTIFFAFVTVVQVRRARDHYV